MTMHKGMREYIEGVYGTRRDMLSLLFNQARYHLGFFSRFEQINWHAVRRLVFICKGNICRSPYAHVLAAGLGLRAISFGLGARTGDTANPDAQRIAIKRGVDLSRHRATRMEPGLLESGDLIVGMEPSHLVHAEGLIGLKREDIQITLMGIWSGFRRPYIADPYGLNDAYFSTCFECIDSNVREMSARLAAQRGGRY